MSDNADGIALKSMAHPRPAWWKRPYYWYRAWRGISKHASEEAVVTIRQDAERYARFPDNGIENAEGNFALRLSELKQSQELTDAALEQALVELAALNGAKPNVTGSLRPKVDKVFAARDGYHACDECPSPGDCGSWATCLGSKPEPDVISEQYRKVHGVGTAHPGLPKWQRLAHGGQMEDLIAQLRTARDPEPEPLDAAAQYLAAQFAYSWETTPDRPTNREPWGFTAAVRDGELCRSDFRSLARNVLKMAVPPAPTEEPRADAEAELNPWHPMTDPVALKHLGKLAEECGELVAALARCIIQGIDEAHPVTGKPNQHQLEDEIADVMAGIGLATEHFKLDGIAMSNRSERKKSGLRKWHVMA